MDGNTNSTISLSSNKYISFTIVYVSGGITVITGYSDGTYTILFDVYSTSSASSENACEDLLVDKTIKFQVTSSKSTNFTFKDSQLQYIDLYKVDRDGTWEVVS